MQSLSARIFSLLSVLFFVVGLGFRLAILLFNLSDSINALFYFFFVLGAIFVALGSVKQANVNRAFDYDKIKRLDVLSYCASAGFFVEFVLKAVTIYSLSQDNSYKSVVMFVPPCVACAMALAGCFYFFAVGMSFGDYGYDFRKLRVLHIAPIFWAIANSLGIMTQAISPLIEVNSVVKYVAYVTSVIYFYFFARELESEDGAKKSFLISSSLFSYFALTYFADSIILLLTRNAEIWNENSFVALSVAMISLFSLFHQRNIKKGA